MSAPSVPPANPADARRDDPGPLHPPRRSRAPLERPPYRRAPGDRGRVHLWDASIPDRFRESAARHAGRLAVQAGDDSLTYAELDTGSDAIARAVLDATGERPDPVAVLLGKRPALIAALLGVWKAGKPVVPLDPSHPARRLEQIRAGSGASLVVSDAAHRELGRALGAGGPRVLDLDATPWRAGAAPPRVSVGPAALATILYTSGSTGVPKGVVQNHRNTLHNGLNLADLLQLSSSDRLSLILAAGTVGSIRDIVGALMSGAAILPFDLAAQGFPALGAWIRAQRLTYVNMVATLFRHLLAALPADARFPDVRIVRVGSEAIAGADLDAFRRHFPPSSVLFTGMGTTETGTATEMLIEMAAPSTPGRVPVGYTGRDFDVLILDDAGRRCTPGTVGEVAIRSEFLALGYWGRPDLTASVFRPDPGDAAGHVPEGARIYLTGDLGRVHPDGCLELSGRRDAQVKLHGSRIDATEIELALQAVPGVRQAAVVVRDRAPGDPRLVAYVAPSTARAPSAAELRRHLLERLPASMVPSAFVALHALPSTPGGKLDRRALPEPEWSGIAPFVAPRTPVEDMLAAIWAEALDAGRVGVHDTFVELGGDSLRALVVIGAVRERLRLDLPATDLLAAGTIAEMAVVVTGALAGRMPETARDHLQARGDLV